MTSPNEWWEEEPFGYEVEYGTHESGGWYFDYDIEAIIEEVKRRETCELVKTFFGLGCSVCPEVALDEHDNYCKGCGRLIIHKT